MTLGELKHKRNVLLQDAQFHHEQGCFSCCQECKDKAAELDAKIKDIQEQGEMWKEDTK